MNSGRRKAYVVQRFGWSYNDEYFYRGGSEGADAVVKAFTDRARAEAYCQAQEEAARQSQNPFEFVSHWASSLTEKQFIRLLDELGLPPPPHQFGCYQWFSWWGEHDDGLSPEQRRRIWDAMDQVRLHEVVEIDIED